MSLNRSEQLIYDYIQSSPDERHHWTAKVRGLAKEAADTPSAVARIDSELWRYYLERSEVAPVIIAAARAFGTKRVSMKNLAEHLVRMWTEPRPKKPTSAGGPGVPDNS